MENPYEASIVEEPHARPFSNKAASDSWMPCLIVTAIACFLFPSGVMTSTYVLNSMILNGASSTDAALRFHNNASIAIFTLAMLLAVLGGILAPRSWPWKIAISVLTIIAIPVIFVVFAIAKWKLES